MQNKITIGLPDDFFSAASTRSSAPKGRITKQLEILVSLDSYSIPKKDGRTQVLEVYRVSTDIVYGVSLYVLSKDEQARDLELANSLHDPEEREIALFQILLKHFGLRLFQTITKSAEVKYERIGRNNIRRKLRELLTEEGWTDEY